eukprot:gene17256-23791_t
MLLALPLPWLAARWLPPAPPRADALFVPFAAQLVERGATPAPDRPRWRVVLFALIWLLLVTAAARPQWLGEPQPVADSGRRLLLAVDVSGSMAAQDMAGRATRLQVVKQVAGDFIRRRHGDRVGLILFGTRPYLQAPLSTDLDTVDQFLQEAAIGSAGPATALGDAIGLALKRLRLERRDSPTTGAARGLDETVLVLLTDGSSNAGEMPPVPAARLAAASRLRIHTIGVGSLDDSDLDETTLKAIAAQTGGAYFRATDAAALQQAYARMDELEPAAAEDRWVRPSDEGFAWPLGLALLLSVPALIATLPGALARFHFLRPGWLLAVPVLLALAAWLSRRSTASGSWDTRSSVMRSAQSWASARNTFQASGCASGSHQSQQRGQVKGRQLYRRCVAAAQCQQLLGAARGAGYFCAQGFQRALHHGTVELAPGAVDLHLQSGQVRAQLVGGIVQKLALLRNQRLA